MWEFEHSHFRRDRKDLLEDIKRKTPGKKKKSENIDNVDNNNVKIEPTEDDNNLVESSTLIELKKLTENLQSQVNELKKSQLELETTVQHLNQKEKIIMAELSGFNESLKAKDAIIQECLKLSQQQYYANTNVNNTVEDKSSPREQQQQQQQPNTSYTATPMDNILTDMFLPPTTAQPLPNVNTTKITESQPFLPLVPPDLPKSMNTQTKDDKGKKKIQANWSTPPRVLLVDDDSLYRDVSGRMLNMMGCSINLAKDGLEALQKLSLEKYDLILMVNPYKTYIPKTID